jgi:hypothetical protein
MANIFTLLDELLLDIATCLEYDKTALHLLILASRRWQLIVERLFYHHIEPLIRRERHCRTRQPRYVLLHCSFDGNASLRKHVRSCNVTMGFTVKEDRVMLRGAEDGNDVCVLCPQRQAAYFGYGWLAVLLGLLDGNTSSVKRRFVTPCQLERMAYHRHSSLLAQPAQYRDAYSNV